ncbi:hypothetical protein ACWGK1_21600 [Streptomyces wedmorensis]
MAEHKTLLRLSVRPFGSPPGEPVSPAEHRGLVDTWHGESVDVDGVFDHLDQDGDGYLDRPEFTGLWIQFWTSDDPAEPGNLLCGPVPTRR